MSTTDGKIPLKQAEIAISRFNTMAIPHHLGLLKNHRTNIEKSLALGDWNKIRREEINATRVIKQVKNLLLEMDDLREKVCDKDVERFDIMMKNGKQQAYDAMKEYLDLQLKTPIKSKRKEMTLNINGDDDDLSQLQLHNCVASPVEIGDTQMYQQVIPKITSNFHRQEYLLAERQTCFDELEHLQSEIRDLNSMFYNMREMVQVQAESVQAIADNAEEAIEHVYAGETNLRKALSYKKAMYPMVGALLGTCVGGPIGLVAGLKAGGLAAVCCGVMGFMGCSVVQGNPKIMQGNIEEEQDLQQQESIELQHTSA